MNDNLSPSDADPVNAEDTPTAHLYVLIDRSGSMSTMVRDVIGGFNRLLSEQKAEGPDARMTLVLFDSQDPEEVVADAVPISEVVPLDERTFAPRGGTPLLDATGRILVRAAVRAEHLRTLDQPAERILVVTITDGEENQSREYTLDTVGRLVGQRMEEGWTFAFLGAGLDAYGEARGIGYDARSVQAFAPDGAGAEAAFESMSKSTSALRRKNRAKQAIDTGDFFEGDKPAEVERKRQERRRRSS
ncbi:vWA domain-containing protein [Rhabdothermincola salaria]|uniref:vWA domain-containing protein n=1 Tax=Rhabdothermincola salaria TaxID=2903142 RepID=UPI001E3E20B6|nr:vWA domain-containing protein [Rhabdothermincola salaria]MCD9624204.1 VWA domain-containing protein [Rhabdothermincola salaria]